MTSRCTVHPIIIRIGPGATGVTCTACGEYVGTLYTPSETPAQSVHLLADQVRQRMGAVDHFPAQAIEAAIATKIQQARLEARGMFAPPDPAQSPELSWVAEVRVDMWKWCDEDVVVL